MTYKSRRKPARTTLAGVEASILLAVLCFLVLGLALIVALQARTNSRQAEQLRAQAVLSVSGNGCRGQIREVKR